MWHRKPILYQDLYLTILDIDIVKVSPLINANDIMAIRLKVDEYSRMPSKQEDIDFNEQLSQIK